MVLKNLASLAAKGTYEYDKQNNIGNACVQVVLLQYKTYGRKYYP
ncbi:MAG: hypothetical protein JWP67_68, partial [Mucilaginibacter sp.]|nr:hypothetical protein [Mucilaginibacter sp.]